MVDINTLTITWTRSQADRQCTLFKNALGAVMLAEAAVALVLFIWPAWSASLTSWPAPDATLWLRVVGVMWVIINLFQVPALLDPVYRRWPNVIGLSSRLLLAVLAAGLGGFGWIIALVEFIAAGGLALLYGRLFCAELLCRP